MNKIYLNHDDKIQFKNTFEKVFFDEREENDEPQEYHGKLKFVKKINCLNTRKELNIFLLNI